MPSMKENKRYSENDEENEEMEEEDEILMRMPSATELNDNYSLSDEDENYIAERDETNNYEEDEENLSDNELNILQQLEEQEAENDNANDFSGEGHNSTDRIYQNKLTKPVYSVGGTTIGMSKAKLFGLMDEKGNLKIQKNGPVVDKNNQYKRVNNMAKPREIDPELISHAEDLPTFKPSRTKEALAAMKNAKCGYDFVSRLNDDNSDFLDRVGREGTKKGNLTKAQLDSMEADYAVKQDKLQCPKCKKPQSFDEFIENKRNCSQCQMKFEKLNITSGLSFAKKAADKEMERRLKLREKEVELYGAKSKSYILPHTNNREQAIKAAAEQAANENKPVVNNKIKENIRKASMHAATTKVNTEADAKGIAYDNDHTCGANRGAKKSSGGSFNVNSNNLIINRQPEGSANMPINVVEKIAQQNREKAEQLNKALSNIQAQYGGMGSFLQAPSDSSINISTKVKSQPTPAATAQGKNIRSNVNGEAKGNQQVKDKVTQKFERLLSEDI